MRRCVHHRGYLAPRVGLEPTVVGLEGRLPSFGLGEMERANGVEPSRASLATMPRTMRARVLVGVAGFAPATFGLSGRRASVCASHHQLVGTVGLEPT